MGDSTIRDDVQVGGEEGQRVVGYPEDASNRFQLGMVSFFVQGDLCNVRIAWVVYNMSNTLPLKSLQAPFSGGKPKA